MVPMPAGRGDLHYCIILAGVWGEGKDEDEDEAKERGPTLKSVYDEEDCRSRHQLREHRGSELPGAACCMGDINGGCLRQKKRRREQVLRDVVMFVDAGTWPAQDSGMRRIVREGARVE